ncbi:hypothetical protein [Actinomadura violacea]|uniref:Uncharacterized protein n=1 Tax=Actinomadura violacea TaxID=2819934 RepID=A0ABS3RIL4_9ACTN|nr:hypothetical protein [Actinomadura violacea]MBO2456574.1 hypothetical protein [Actinomadura violacea]
MITPTPTPNRHPITTLSTVLGAQATNPHAAEGRPSRPITGPNETPHSLSARRPLHAGPVKRCPTCRTPLDGGPIRFRCEPCGRSVMAADLDTEYHPTAAPNPARTDDHEGRDRR